MGLVSLPLMPAERSNNEPISASGALNFPFRSEGGKAASTASSFSVGSTRRQISVELTLLCPSQSASFRMSRVACRTISAQLWRSWCGDTDQPFRLVPRRFVGARMHAGLGRQGGIAVGIAVEIGEG